MSECTTAHHRSVADPAAIRLDGGGASAGVTPPTTAVDESRPPFYRWFPDGELNTSYNCVDRHVEAGHGTRAAIIHDSPVTGVKETITYAQLLARVEIFAGALAAEGVDRGDRAVI